MITHKVQSILINLEIVSKKAMKILKSISLLLIFFGLGLIIVLFSNYYLTLQVNAQQTGTWDFAARVMPDALSQQVKKESFEPGWIGDPRRFTAVRYRKDSSEFYLVWTNTDCPEKGCLEFYHRPTCGAAGQCQFVGYAKQGDRYKKVFSTYLLQQLSFKKGFSSITNQWIDGVPECFTLAGIDPISSPKQVGDDMGRVTYCYSQVEKKFKYRDTKFEKFPANQRKW